jgi:nucleoside-diphosphate-sugar epimerase
MSASGWVLLTGATGFVGRYLLRDLLASGRQVAVLARDARGTSADERIQGLAALWANAPPARPTSPVVLTGDLRARGLGLSAAERHWAARHVRCVVHAAADVSFRRSPTGDPWATNVEGTERLLDLCAAQGVPEFHHVSTAFVCGDRVGPAGEDELDRGQGFHNEYERSKFEAERRVRASRGVRATVYRPSVVVGDSRTGHTSSYHGFYRFLELGARLAAPQAGLPSGRRLLPLRLPLTGDEPRNLVPVDWVARAVVRLVNDPRRHGRTYHLAARQPVSAREVEAAAAEILGIDGVTWAGPGTLDNPTTLEGLFLQQVRDYWPYFRGDPAFDCRNARAALPDLPPPPIDRPLLARLIRFAVADRWGRRGRQGARAGGLDCARYVEEFFPEAARRSTLARIPLDVTVTVAVTGPGGGQWSLRWGGEGLLGVWRGREPDAQVTYRMDVPTFEAVVRGGLSPHDAFLARQIEIEGDVEKGLKLAVLFGHFVQESPFAPQQPEAADAAALPA